MRFCFLSVLFLVVHLNSTAQYFSFDTTDVKKQYYAAVIVNSGIMGEHVPFWMRSHQYGSIPLSGISIGIIGSARKEYGVQTKSFWDWGAGLEVRTNAGKKVEAIFVEAYAKAKIGKFQIKGGRWKEVIGLCDSSLSSGSFVISGNALGIPKVEVSVPEFSNLLGGKLFAFKGSFAHGWVGEVPMRQFTQSARTYFHQKSFYVRFGKPEWKLKLTGGFSHNVFWGDERKIFADEYFFSDWKSYLYVVLGKVAFTRNVAKVGNHLGSIDFGADYNFRNTVLRLYRQQFYDVGALSKLANVLDGLNGVAVINKRQRRDNFHWKKILFELMYSANQAGQPWSPKTASGAENYYNHDIYSQGWSYKALALGNPFMTRRLDARDGQASNPNEYFINNRLLLFHTAMECQYKNWNVVAKLSYSKNKGTWATSSYGRRTANGLLQLPIYGIFKEVGQFSGFAEISKRVSNGLILSGSMALDYGKLLPNSFGTMFKLSKSF
jgi:hypothetical protein